MSHSIVSHMIVGHSIDGLSIVIHIIMNRTIVSHSIDRDLYLGQHTFRIHLLRLSLAYAA